MQVGVVFNKSRVAMGSCCCSHMSSITDDPETTFYTEAIHLVSILDKENIPDNIQETPVLLYIRKGRLHHVPRCRNLLCCMCCGYSRKLSDLGDVEVISGRLRVETYGRIMTDYNVDPGVKIGVMNWFDPFIAFLPYNVTKIYETPDAVQLATLLQPHVKGQVITKPTVADRVITNGTSTRPNANVGYASPAVPAMSCGGFSGGCKA